MGVYVNSAKKPAMGRGLLRIAEDVAPVPVGRYFIFFRYFSGFFLNESTHSSQQNPMTCSL